MEKTLYQAKRLEDGSVLRVSVSVATVNALLVMALKPVTLIFIVILVISFILARNVSRRIVNEVKGVNRVLYDCTSKPPSTIEFE